MTSGTAVKYLNGIKNNKIRVMKHNNGIYYVKRIVLYYYLI